MKGVVLTLALVTLLTVTVEAQKLEHEELLENFREGAKPVDPHGRPAAGEHDGRQPAHPSAAPG